MPLSVDYTGRKFGTLTGTADTGSRAAGSGNAIWAWVCECGRTRNAAAHRLARHTMPRCCRGCPLAPPRRSKPEPVDRRGLSPAVKHGRLTPVRAVSADRPRGLWHFTCDCGGGCVAAARTVLAGRRKSCGCLGRAATAANGRLAATRPGAGLKTVDQSAAVRLDPAALHAARAARGLTLARLADAAGVSTSAVHGYEKKTGRCVPVSVAQRLAKSLGVSVPDLTRLG